GIKGGLVLEALQLCQGQGVVDRDGGGSVRLEKVDVRGDAGNLVSQGLGAFVAAAAGAIVEGAQAKRHRGGVGAVLINGDRRRAARGTDRGVVDGIDGNAQVLGQGVH